MRGYPRRRLKTSFLVQKFKLFVMPRCGAAFWLKEIEALELLFHSDQGLPRKPGLGFLDVEVHAFTLELRLLAVASAAIKHWEGVSSPDDC